MQALLGALVLITSAQFFVDNVVQAVELKSDPLPLQQDNQTEDHRRHNCHS